MNGRFDRKMAGKNYDGFSSWEMANGNHEGFIASAKIMAPTQIMPRLSTRRRDSKFQINTL